MIEKGSMLEMDGSMNKGVRIVFNKFFAFQLRSQYFLMAQIEEDSQRKNQAVEANDESIPFQNEEVPSSPTTTRISLSLCAILIVALLHYVIARSNLASIQTTRFNLLENVLKVQCLANKFCEISRNDFCTDIKQMSAQIDSFSQNFVAKSGFQFTERSCQNAFMQMFVNAMYHDEPAMLAERMKFHQKRIEFVNANERLTAIKFSKYNMYTPLTNLSQRKIDFQSDYEELNKKYNYESFKKELPFCVGVPSYKNDINFRIESNMHSLLAQNYTNFRVVIVDDFSPDKTSQRIKRYLNFYGLSQPFVKFIQHDKNSGALQNLYNIFHNECAANDIAVTFDGDDEILGLNIFKSFNVVYQKERPGFAYSNYYFFNQFKGIIFQSRNQQIPRQYKQANNYRNIPYMFSQIRTFLVSIFRQIKKADLVNREGGFYRMTYDEVTMFPMLEMCCGRVGYVAEVQMLYNYFMQNNDVAVNHPLQAAIGAEVLQKQRYSCSEKFLADVKNDSLW